MKLPGKLAIGFALTTTVYLIVSFGGRGKRGRVVVWNGSFLHFYRYIW